MKSLKTVAVLSIVAIVSASLTYVVMKSKEGDLKSSTKAKAYAALNSSNLGGCDVKLVRSSSKDFVRPILFADSDNESQALVPLKAQLQNQIDSMVQTGQLIRASVYLKALNSPDWISINGTSGYHPGSMLKVAVLITWLSSIDKNPEILHKTIRLMSNLPVEVTTVSGQKLKLGESYTIEDLMKVMIIDSNNEATAALIDNMNREEFNRLFRELRIEVPDLNNLATEMNPVDFARLLRVLYNGAYLSRKNSEFALELMSKAAFKGGLVKYLPNDVPVAHKFGERFSQAGQQFHEAGVIYAKQNPYVMVVMTEGRDKRMLPESIAILSRTAYQMLNN